MQRDSISGVLSGTKRWSLGSKHTTKGHLDDKDYRKCNHYQTQECIHEDSMCCAESDPKCVEKQKNEPNKKQGQCRWSFLPRTTEHESSAESEQKSRPIGLHHVAWTSSINQLNWKWIKNWKCWLPGSGTRILKVMSPPWEVRFAKKLDTMWFSEPHTLNIDSYYSIQFS